MYSVFQLSREEGSIEPRGSIALTTDWMSWDLGVRLLIEIGFLDVVRPRALVKEHPLINESFSSPPRKLGYLLGAVGPPDFISQCYLTRPYHFNSGHY